MQLRTMGALVLIGVLSTLPALAKPAAKPSPQDTLNASLRTACQNDDLAQATDLLTQGADVNAQEPDVLATPLIYAASQTGDAPLIALLLSHGAKVNPVDVLGMNALMWAAHAGSVENMDALLKAGADINATDKTGQTALFDAWQSPDALKDLLDHGSAVNASDRDDVHPLDIAAAIGSAASVNTLIAHGADVNAKDRQKETAFTFASKRNAPDRDTIVSALIAAGEKDAKVLPPQVAEDAIAPDSDDAAVIHALVVRYNTMTPGFVVSADTIDRKKAVPKDVITTYIDKYLNDFASNAKLIDSLLRTWNTPAPARQMPPYDDLSGIPFVRWGQLEQIFRTSFLIEKIYPGASGILVIGNPAFDPGHNNALVFQYWLCGPTCTTLAFTLLHKENGAWVCTQDLPGWQWSQL